MVEDEKAIRDIALKTWLKGYDAEGFAFPDEAYEAIAFAAERNNPYDLLLFDIMLQKDPDRARKRQQWQYHDTPISDGVDLAQQVRKLEAYKSTPLIFLSNKLGKEQDAAILRDKLNAICIPKTPVHGKSLYATVRETVGAHLGHPEPGYWEKVVRLFWKQQTVAS